MLLSLNWLREFVPYTGTAEALGERLTMVGLELESVQRPFAALEPIVVGHVVECGRHPEADKLSVCRVDVGNEVLDIVCGAPNVAKGQKVAVVKVGSTLPGGLTIKAAKLRGAPSHGMICSESELGLSEDHGGIMVLDAQLAPGTRLVDALGLDDAVLDISITPNRGDCLSVLGLARETAAAFGLPLTLPSLDLQESGADASKEVALEVDGELSPLYQARIIENAVTGKSPDWLRYRLKSIGVRAISNLVDVTNYILMELGQPLHAFDLDTVRGGRVIVRGAGDGEKLVSLDGQERVLCPADITIRDAERAIGLGGVMGGLNSEITEKSRRVFLECAVFAPARIRRTAKRLGLHSEASYRFERGVDQVGATYALDRAAAMMAKLSGGAVRPGIIKAEPRPWKTSTITLRRQRAQDLLGIPLTSDFCQTTLQSLGCSLSDAQNTRRDGECDCPEVWSVSPPSHRPDLEREADLIEELARIYGVDKIPSSLPSVRHSLDRAGRPEPLHAFLMRVKHWAAGAGLNEAVNYSFLSHKELDYLGFGPEYGGGRISLLNPLSEEQNTLRTAIAPSLFSSLRNNLAQGAPSVRLFEAASIFFADAASETTAREPQRLGMLLCGARYDGGWPYPQGDLDYQDIKGCVEHFAKSFGLPAPSFELAAEPGFLAPCVAVLFGNERAGFAGKVKPALADAFHAKKEVWLAELDLNFLYRLSQEAQPRFTALPSFPPVRRDITFIAAPGVTVQTIIAAVDDLKRSKNLTLLEDVRLIDYFEPKDKEEKNLTFRLTFRHHERTLKDDEADKQRETVASAVAKVLPVRV